jgi:hypothetical protein
MARSWCYVVDTVQFGELVLSGRTSIAEAREWAKGLPLGSVRSVRRLVEIKVCQGCLSRPCCCPRKGAKP